MSKTILCPNCTKELQWVPEETHRPFCSQRCRLIDLGEWASDNYKIPDKESALFDESFGDSIPKPE